MAIDKNGSINVASITCTENSSTDIFAFLSDSPPSTESMPHYDDGDIFSWLSSSDSITFSTAKTTEADRNLLGMQTNCFANASVVPCSQYAQTIFGNSLFGVLRKRQKSDDKSVSVFDNDNDSFLSSLMLFSSNLSSRSKSCPESSSDEYADMRNYGNAFPFIQLLNLSRTSSDNDEFVYSRPPIPPKQRKLESNAKSNANFYIECDIEAKNKTAEFLDMVKYCQDVPIKWNEKAKKWSRLFESAYQAELDFYSLFWFQIGPGRIFTSQDVASVATFVSFLILLLNLFFASKMLLANFGYSLFSLVSFILALSLHLFIAVGLYFNSRKMVLVYFYVIQAPLTSITICWLIFVVCPWILRDYDSVRGTPTTPPIFLSFVCPADGEWKLNDHLGCLANFSGLVLLNSYFLVFLGRSAFFSAAIYDEIIKQKNKRDDKRSNKFKRQNYDNKKRMRRNPIIFDKEFHDHLLENYTTTTPKPLIKLYNNPGLNRCRKERDVPKIFSPAMFYASTRSNLPKPVPKPRVSLIKDKKLRRLNDI